MTIVFAMEGGYVYDPQDKGGETKYGISKSAFPEEDIKHLTKTRAKELYRKHYYEPSKASQIANRVVAMHFFDHCVNGGLRGASRLLQKAAGGVDVDGLVGPKTLERVNSLGSLFICDFIEARKSFYIGLKNPRFEKGWLNRVDNVTRRIL